MNDFIDWFQTNWIDLARLAVQAAILVAVVRFGRRILIALRASQEQVGALLKLSVSDSVRETHSSPVFEEPVPVFRDPAPVHEAPAPAHLAPAPAFSHPLHAPASSGLQQSLGGRVIPSRETSSAVAIAEPPAPPAAPAYTPWVEAPAVTTPVDHGESGHEHEALSERPPMQWLQAAEPRKSVNPLRRIVRWLQAPAGS
jgi:hypothetical protein